MVPAIANIYFFYCCIFSYFSFYASTTGAEGGVIGAVEESVEGAAEGVAGGTVEEAFGVGFVSIIFPVFLDLLTLFFFFFGFCVPGDI